MNTSHRKIYRDRKCKVYVLSEELVNWLSALLLFYGGMRIEVRSAPVGKSKLNN